MHILLVVCLFAYVNTLINSLLREFDAGSPYVRPEIPSC